MSVEELQPNELAWPVPDHQATRARAAWLAKRLRVAALACALAVDAGLVVGAVVIANWLIFGLQLKPEVAGFGVVVGVVSAAIFATQGFYDPTRFAEGGRLVKLVFSMLSVALVAATMLHRNEANPSAQVALLAPTLLIGGFSLLVWRGMFQPWCGNLDEPLRAGRRVLIVGANRVGQTLADELGRKCHVVGYADDGAVQEAAGLPVLGSIGSVEQLVETYAVDDVIVALPGGRRQLRNTLTRGFARRVRVSFLADMGALLPQNFAVQVLAARPYVSFEPVASVSWLKRASDVVLGILAVCVFGPLFVLIALAIKLDSPGPVFHRQNRIGRHGQPFSMLKFRSMRYDAENVLSLLGDRNEVVGPMFKIRRDPRVTRVGRWLRRTSLDELPQLFNVVRGEMSLVGPRPPLPEEVAQYEDWQFGRLRVRPGMTGLWQVGGRSEVPFIEMVRLDLYYARNWSLWLDLKILLRTPPSVVSGRGAY
jgi:exopolysaccharide biosynthesis polyprenyl glycosylphosphotransferase